MLKKYLLLSLLVFLFYNELISQCTQGAVTTFQKVYGGTGNERAHSVKQTSDGGYVVVGETTSYGAGGKDFFVMKINSVGVQQWMKTYGTSSTEDGNSISIIETSDGGYLLGGNTQGFGAGSLYDSFIIKIDNLGNQLWAKRGVGSGLEIFRDMVELNTGNFLVVGNTSSVGAGNQDVHAVMFSTSGNVLWSKAYGGVGNDQGTAVMELPFGNSLISCYTLGYGAGSADGLLIKIDALGNVIWTKAYGGTSIEHYMTTHLLSDGNIVGVGTTNSYGVGNEDIIISKIDTNGNIIWTKTLGSSAQDKGLNAFENQNGEIIISGYSNSFGANYDVIMAGLDLSGNLLWSKKYGGASNDEVDNWSKPMIVSQDNGIVFAGGTYSFGGAGEEIYITKTNECGQSFCNESIINLSITSPNVIITNVILSTNFGVGYVSETPLSSSFSFTDNYLCEDTLSISSPCNLTANFSNTTACFGDTTFFNDLSIDSVGNIINWQWYFGDGDSLVGVQNPNHIYLTTGNFNVTLVVTNNSNCVDSITIVLTINPTFLINRNDSICQGDSILLGGVFQTTPGNYTDSLQTINGCDSILITALAVNPVFSSTQNLTICQGDSILFNGNFYSLGGNYTDSLQTINGCDSLLILNLSINPTFQTNTTLSICQGDSVLLGGVFQTASGVYTDSLQTILGCDSLIITTLTVGNIYNDSLSQNICLGDSIFLGGAFQFNAGIYYDSLQTNLGCDSIVYTTLTIDTALTLTITDDVISTPCIPVQLNISGGNSYVWSPTEGLSCTTCDNPIASPIVTTTYVVTEVSNNCNVSASVTIFIEGESELIIPNVFTPNYDNINDGFNVKSSCIYSLEKKIYNRWGQLLFHSTQINEPWNGRTTTGDEAPEGTYFYIFNVGMYESNMETTNIFKGTVTLLR